MKIVIKISHLFPVSLSSFSSLIYWDISISDKKKNFQNISSSKIYSVFLMWLVLCTRLTLKMFGEENDFKHFKKSEKKTAK